MKISVVVPCYNEEQTIEYFYEEMNKVSTKIKNYEFEYIFIDDGSKDKTLEKIKNLVKRDEKVRFGSFSRNFGKEAAIYAGLKKSIGEYVVLMDADLQDPPVILLEMISYLENGYDSVATRRIDRKGEPKIRSFFARAFYKIINKISDIEIVDGARDYRIMNRLMINSILDLKEYNRFSKGIFSWVGFKTKWLEYENQKRVAGETKWSFWKLFKYSIEGIIGFSIIPLQISSIFGFLLSIFSFIMILFVVVRTLIYGDPVAGWPSLVSIIMLVSGVQLLCIGILGTYISKVYLEVKNRPIYVMKEEEK